MPLDLTKYTGENQTAMTSPEPSTNYGAAGGGTMAFDARSRGQLLSGTTAGDDLWTPASTAPAGWTSQVRRRAVAIQHPGLPQPDVLDQFSRRRQDRQLSMRPRRLVLRVLLSQIVLNPALDNNSDAASDDDELQHGDRHVAFNGDPLLPFPWLTWNNRPFVSQYERCSCPRAVPPVC